MRFSVTSRAQSALFRRVRFSSPAQTRRRLTENRTLAQPAHGKPHSAAVPRSRRDQKAHSATRASRKSALCSWRLTKNRTLAQPPHQKVHSALALPPSTWYRAALASLITKGVVLKVPVLVDAIAVDLVLGYAYAARVEDRDARMRVPSGVRLEHPLVRVSVHKGCPRR